MDLKENSAVKFIKYYENLIYYFLIFLFFILGKFGFHYADTDSLKFILAPTNKILSILIGFSAIYVPGDGYYYEALNIFINKDCSGINFLLLSFLAFSYLILQYCEKSLSKLLSILLTLIFVYTFTIFVNSARIFTAILLQEGGLKIFSNHQGLLHESIGIIVNLSFLILAYLIVEKKLKHKREKNEKIT